MKRIAAFMVLLFLSIAFATPADAQRMSNEEYARKSSREAKKQQKMLRKANKKQRKAMKKYEKVQRKATMKANRRHR